MPWIDASVPGPGLRPYQAAVPACLHGGIGDAELRALGLRRADVLDFSASTNPLGPSTRVAEALTEFAAGGDLGRYPDDGCPRLREALAAHTGYPPDQLIVANGSVEILWLLALAYLGPGDRVLVVGPTFGEYARAARIAGAAVVEWHAAEARDFRPDPDALAAVVRRTRPRLAFLCNPNNPTSILLDRVVVTHLLAALQEGLLVVDEAYAAFADDAPRLSPLLGDGRLVLLRSLTKDYGLAGLRLGYTLGASMVIAALDRVRPPWNVNAAAEVAGLAALSDEAHLARARGEVVTARAYLVDALRHLGLRVYPPAANFLLVDVGSTPAGDGQAFRNALLRYGICVRDCASFGLPSCVRIGVRTQAACACLVAAAAEVLAHA
jgi:histidinol-phosphate aminotransferase